jgi:hypothetical protein
MIIKSSSVNFDWCTISVKKGQKYLKSVTSEANDMNLQRNSPGDTARQNGHGIVLIIGR